MPILDRARDFAKELQMSKDSAVKILNDLIETSEDGKKGFAEAVEKSADPKLKMLFNDCAMQCEDAAQELRHAVQILGGQPETGGSLAGAAHRGWLSAKAAVKSDSNAAVLEEVERG